MIIVVSILENSSRDIQQELFVELNQSNTDLIIHSNLCRVINFILVSFIAVCEGGCKMGGICMAPNTCLCPQGYSGKNCEIGK